MRVVASVFLKKSFYLNFKSTRSVQFFQPDGFTITATEPWFKVKVQVITNYIQAFTTHAVQKADEIVIVDLFAGSGLFSVGHQREIFPSASMVSLGEDLPVSKWILCEQNPESTQAIKARIGKYYSDKPVFLWNISSDEWVDKLRGFIPPSKGGFKTAVLCIVDPFSIDVSFKSIDKLASLGYSFLMPYTFTLNERRNFEYYLSEDPEKLKAYIGNSGYDSLKGVTGNPQFYKKLIRLYQNNMLMLGLNTSLSVHKLHSSLMDLPAYYMGFFSRQFSTKAIQNDIQASDHLQFDLFN